MKCWNYLQSLNYSYVTFDDATCYSRQATCHTQIENKIVYVYDSKHTTTLAKKRTTRNEKQKIHHSIHVWYSCCTHLKRQTMNWKKKQFVLPETQSTTTKAPSVTRRAAVTSDEKSTCPGESIKLIKKPFCPFSHWSAWVMNTKSLSSNSKYIEMALCKKKSEINIKIVKGHFMRTNNKENSSKW